LWWNLQLAKSQDEGTGGGIETAVHELQAALYQDSA